MKRAIRTLANFVLFGGLVLALAGQAYGSQSATTTFEAPAGANTSADVIAQYDDDHGHCQKGNHCCTFHGHDCKGPFQCIGTPCSCTIHAGDHVDVEQGTVCQGGH